MKELAEINSLHLVSERKFLPWIKRAFERPAWNNQYIVLQYNRKHFFNSITDDEIEVSPDEFGKEIVLSKVNKADVVFHYFLDFPKADIVLRSGPRVQHYWYFFGAEIYQQTDYFRKGLYGPQTKRVLDILPEVKYRYELRRLYYKWILQSVAPKEKLKECLMRINNILWYVDDEIEMIREKIELPPWLFFQFFTFSDMIPDMGARTQSESAKILIGNSATIENNHFDVLEALKRIKDFSYDVSLPMTYGQFKRYKIKLKKAFRTSLGDKVHFLESHLSLPDYYRFLDQHPTAIFMHYRQQGLGNIFYLIYNGTRVYLSKHNIIYSWLRKHRILVYSFEDSFLTDYNTGQLTMDSDLIQMNRTNLRALLDHTRNDDTIKIIESTLYTVKTI